MAAHDIDEWVDLVDDLLRQPLLPGWHRQVLPHLFHTFGTPVSWHWYLSDGSFGFDACGMPPDWPPAGWPPPEGRDQWRTALMAHPLIQWFLRSGDSAALTICRVPTEVVSLRHRQAVQEVLCSGGVDQQLSMPLHLAGTSLTCPADGPALMAHRAFVFSQPRCDYTDTQLALARQLQPLLRLVDRQSLVLESAPVVNHDTSALALTGRERAVLVLLAQGLTALAIAHRLAISERTVHKHVERMYRKLGVSDRLSAVYAASAHGLLAEPTPPSEEPGPSATLPVRRIFAETGRLCSPEEAPNFKGLPRRSSGTGTG